MMTTQLTEFFEIITIQYYVKPWTWQMQNIGLLRHDVNNELEFHEKQQFT